MKTKKMAVILNPMQNTIEKGKRTEWRVGDAGHTIFGPPNGTPTPKVIARVERREHAQLLVRAVNAHDALLEACGWALVQVRQDNDERKVPEHLRGTEKQLEAAIALAEGKE